VIFDYVSFTNRLLAQQKSSTYTTGANPRAIPEATRRRVEQIRFFQRIHVAQRLIRNNRAEAIGQDHGASSDLVVCEVADHPMLCAGLAPKCKIF